MTASCISISGRNKKHRKRENENRELITLGLLFAAIIKDRGSAFDLWTYMQIMQHMTNHSPDILIVVRRTSEDLEGVSIQRIASSLP
jgi:hypothetical protein